MGIFSEEQRKTFSQIWVKIYLCTFPTNSYRNTEANHDISFYPTKTLVVFSTGNLPWKCRYFRYLFPVFTTSLKADWAQIFTSALTLPHACFKIFIKMLQCLWDETGQKKKNNQKTGRHLFFSSTYSPFFCKIATDDA